MRALTVAIQSLSNVDLMELVDKLNVEVIRRNPPQGPTGKPGPSYESLVEQYGVDGNQKLGLTNVGYKEPIQVYQLGEIPFAISYDDQLGAFVYQPTERFRRMFRKAVHETSAPDTTALNVLHDAFEILIDPQLGFNSLIKLMLPTSNVSVPLELVSLTDLVEWYKANIQPSLLEVVPFYPAFYTDDAEQKALLTFGEKSLVREVEWHGLNFTTAPYRVGQEFNVNVWSNIMQLEQAGELPSTAQLDRNPTVTSLFVKVGPSLLRVMTANTPYARFVNAVEGNGERLDMSVAINITRGMHDCFGEVMEWTNLLGEEGLDLELVLPASYYAATGTMKVGRGAARFFIHDQAGAAVNDLLISQTEILGFTLDGQIAHH